MLVMLVMLAVPDYMFRKGDTDRIIIPLRITCLGAVVAITCLGSLSYVGRRSADSEIKRELIPSNLHSTYLKRFCIIKLLDRRLVGQRILQPATAFDYKNLILAPLATLFLPATYLFDFGIGCTVYHHI